jgi:hypothetical protein
MTKNPLIWIKATRIAWGIHRKTRHLPARERQRVLYEVQKALYEGQTTRKDT